MLLGITGLKGHGKGEVARVLVKEYNYTLLKFAGPLKAMLRALGLIDAEIEGSLKEKPCDLLCGQTPRFAMQKLGTEWGRGMIGDSLWIDLLEHEVSVARKLGTKNIVVDDVRFPNEMKKIQALDGVIIKVVRPAFDADLSHPSEQYVAGIEPDIEIMNDDTVENLHGITRHLANHFGESA